MNRTAMFLGMLAVGFANAQYDGRVGINTKTPSATLSVHSNPGTADSEKNLQLFKGDGTQLVTVLNSGKVGIGTATPSEALHIVGKARIQGLATNRGAVADKVVVVDNAGVLKSVDRSTLGGGTGGATLDAITGGVRSVAEITVEEWAKWTGANGTAQAPNTAGAVPTFALILTGDTDIHLPNPSNYKSRIIAISNQSGGPQNILTNPPANNSSIFGGKGLLLMSDGTKWYTIGGY